MSKDVNNPVLNQPPIEDERKVTLTIYTTPAELRSIAADLESHTEVRVNWYHTRYSFRNEQTYSKGGE